uniref:Uncharacterized protein n=1 Tax=Romanomermis culicivorax TaxID=13658 RepID=A0A915KGY2_ROMCU
MQTQHGAQCPLIKITTVLAVGNSCNKKCSSEKCILMDFRSSKPRNFSALRDGNDGNDHCLLNPAQAPPIVTKNPVFSVYWFGIDSDSKRYLNDSATPKKASCANNSYLKMSRFWKGRFKGGVEGFVFLVWFNGMLQSKSQNNGQLTIM